MTDNLVDLFALVIWWGLVLLGTRKDLCKRARFWTSLFILSGSSIVAISVITHCIFSYLSGATPLEWDPQIIRDTLQLKIRSRMTVYGYFFFLLGIESYIVCRYFRTTVLAPIWHKIILAIICLIVFICIGMIISIALGIHFI